MAFRAVGFTPCCPNVNGMYKFKWFPYGGVLHCFWFALANNRMADVAITCNPPPGFRNKSIIMASEATLCFEVPYMIRVSTIIHSH